MSRMSQLLWSRSWMRAGSALINWKSSEQRVSRSEEHTSELQSRSDLVCRLLLEKKKYDDEGPPAVTLQGTDSTPTTCHILPSNSSPTASDAPTRSSKRIREHSC